MALVSSVMGASMTIGYFMALQGILLVFRGIAALRLSYFQEVRLRMASHSQLFSISYRVLLGNIAEELGWSEPLYCQFNMTQNAVCVLLRRSHSPIAFSFSGAPKVTLAESEEDAAEQAVDYLVQKGRVIVDDVNLERREMYKACSRFYKDKRTAFELIKRVPARVSMLGAADPNNHTLGNGAKIVSIDFWELLIQIFTAFQISTTEVEDLVFDNDSRVCTLRINWENSYNKVCHFIGECSPTLEKDRQSLAKKIVAYLETIYGFGVKDANYYNMIYAEMRCGVERERYLAVKDKMERELRALAAPSGEGCLTPDGPKNQICTGLTLPPPPKKLKSIWMATASSSINKGPMNQIPNADVLLVGKGADVSGGAEEGV